MPNRVFLLHGMGFHPADWHKDTSAFLEDFVARHGDLGGFAVGDFFKFVPLEYDSVFRTYLQTLKTRTQELANVRQMMQVMPGSAPTDWVDRLVDWGNKVPGTEDNFAWSHAFDVILYRFMPSLRFEIHAHLAQQIQAEISGMASNERWSIIAHSLGTAVCHDLCHRWFTANIGGLQLGLHERPNVLLMLANVSRIVQNDIKVLESTVRPGQACTRYLTTLHRLDPFTLLRPFDPVAWPPDPAERSRYALFEVKHVYQANIHDLLHYLRHPDVVISLFRALGTDGFIPPDKEAAYRAEFRDANPLSEAQLVDLTNWLSDLREGRFVPPPKMPALVAAYKPIFDFLGRLT